MTADGVSAENIFDDQKPDQDVLSGGAHTGTAPAETPKDYFMVEGGERYAGKHLLIDIRGGRKLNDCDYIEGALRDCVKATGATLLHIHLHHFTPYGGVSGVAVLAESHISFHSWPEENFAALDVFMCGNTNPENAIEVLRRAFAPTHMDVQIVKRGRVDVVK